MLSPRCPPCADARRLLARLMLLVALATPLWADPGHLDLAASGFAPAAVPDLDLSIGAAEFAVAAFVASKTDTTVAALLANVQAFHLRQYAAPDAATVTAAEALVSALAGDGWRLVESETQGTRQITVYTMMQDTTVAGLTVIAIDPGLEVSVANVVGDISPSQLSALGLPVP